MTKAELISIAAEVQQRGPTRVLIDSDTAIPHRRALRECAWYTAPDIVFIRDDGWSLGAPTWLELDAFALWVREWVAFMRGPNMVDAIANYRPPIQDVS